MKTGAKLDQTGIIDSDSFRDEDGYVDDLLITNSIGAAALTSKIEILKYLVEKIPGEINHKSYSTKGQFN